LFYDLDVVGSDIECHPETYDAQTRHVPENLYATELTIDFSDAVVPGVIFLQGCKTG